MVTESPASALPKRPTTAATTAMNGTSAPLPHPGPSAVGFPVSAASPALWTGFYKKTVEERRDLLALAFPHVAQPAFAGLDDTAADNMVENCIG